MESKSLSIIVIINNPYVRWNSIVAINNYDNLEIYTVYVYYYTYTYVILNGTKKEEIVLNRRGKNLNWKKGRFFSSLKLQAKKNAVEQKKYVCTVY